MFLNKKLEYEYRAMNEQLRRKYINLKYLQRSRELFKLKFQKLLTLRADTAVFGGTIMLADRAAGAPPLSVRVRMVLAERPPPPVWTPALTYGFSRDLLTFFVARFIKPYRDQVRL